MFWNPGPLGCYQDSDCPGYGVCRNGECEFPILGGGNVRRGPTPCTSWEDCVELGTDCQDGFCEEPQLTSPMTPRQMRRLRRRLDRLYAMRGGNPSAVEVKACLGDTVKICKTFTINLPTNCPQGQVVCGSNEPGAPTICCDPVYPPPGYGPLQFSLPMTPRQRRKAQRRAFRRAFSGY